MPRRQQPATRRMLKKRRSKRLVEEGSGPAAIDADCFMTLVVNGGVLTAATDKEGAVADSSEEEVDRRVEEFISAFRHLSVLIPCFGPLLSNFGVFSVLPRWYLPSWKEVCDEGHISPTILLVVSVKQVSILASMKAYVSSNLFLGDRHLAAQFQLRC